jgi:hypothetical protein
MTLPMLSDEDTEIREAESLRLWAENYKIVAERCFHRSSTLINEGNQHMKLHDEVMAQSEAIYAKRNAREKEQNG